eukprot:1151995-Pelagomonas_calceolata.AAC.2
MHAYTLPLAHLSKISRLMMPTSGSTAFVLPLFNAPVDMGVTCARPKRFAPLRDRTGALRALLGWVGALARGALRAVGLRRGAGVEKPGLTAYTLKGTRKFVEKEHGWQLAMQSKQKREWTGRGAAAQKNAAPRILTRARVGQRQQWNTKRMFGPSVCRGLCSCSREYYNASPGLGVAVGFNPGD